MQGIETIIPQDRIKYNEDMSRHTTFRIGGKADCFVTTETEQEFVDVISYLRTLNSRYYVIGNGSNLLVSDEGFRGTIVQMKEISDSIKISEDSDGADIYVGAGVRLSKLAVKMAECSLTGFEFAAGIPGTLGGAVIMNAGAYGGEMKDCITGVRILDDAGKIREISNEEAQFGYRTSGIMHRDELVLGARLHLSYGDRKEIQAQMDKLAQCRREKQPLEYPSAGSTFKRPEGYFAGKLIMDAGLRGYRVGDAAVSEKHCGFVVNLGAATAQDVRQLIEDVSRKVYEQFGVELEPEVRFLS